MVSIAAWDYGYIEARYIPTSTGNFEQLPGVFHHFSYYHLGLLVLMAAVSFLLALSHIQWILTNRKKYILFMCIASMPLSLMIEDIAWFCAMNQPIRADEWTMLLPNLGINFFGLTWIPLWYFIVGAFSGTMLWLSNRFANKGYEDYRAMLAKTQCVEQK
jgi:hypothetical protein